MSKFSSWPEKFSRYYYEKMFVANSLLQIYLYIYIYYASSRAFELEIELQNGSMRYGEGKSIALLLKETWSCLLWESSETVVVSQPFVNCSCIRPIPKCRGRRHVLLQASLVKYSFPSPRTVFMDDTAVYYLYSAS